jgi:hypothetical protein
MPVTDLTPTLPWGGSPNGQTQLPPGYGGGTSWLNYLASMFNPVSPAQADVLHPNLNNSQAALHPMYNFSNPPPANGPGPGNVGPVQLADSVTMAPPGQGALPQARGVANPPFPRQTFAGSQPNQGGGFDQGILPQARGVAVQPGPMAPGNSILQPGADRGVAPSPAAPGATAAPSAAPQGGGPSNRFVQLDQGQNIDPTNRRGGPQMTALNLAGLFGGGGQPQGTPSQTPRPAVPGPMAQGGISPTTGQPMPMSSADAAYGLPDARGAPYPYALGRPDYRSIGDTPATLAATRRAAAAQLAAASLKQRYG